MGEIAEPIGEGTFVLVVGPSGAGKDTLIAAAREVLAKDSRFVFPKRVVTRTATSFEDHDTIDLDSFRQRAAAGDFALSWEAHGLGYGLPVWLDRDIRDGRVVVANVSRGAIAAARQRYQNIHVLYINASAEVLAARIAARGREAPSTSRLDAARGHPGPETCDAVIDNSAAVEAAAETFIRALMDLA